MNLQQIYIRLVLGHAMSNVIILGLTPMERDIDVTGQIECVRPRRIFRLGITDQELEIFVKIVLGKTINMTFLFTKDRFGSKYRYGPAKKKLSIESKNV